MLNKAKASFVAAALAFGIAAAPALAQNQTGLVNVAIDDVTVTIPIQAAANIAANVCGTAVNVLSLAVGQSVECTSRAESGRQLQFTRVR